MESIARQDGEGKVVQFQTAVTDITTAILSQATLREAEERFRLIAQTSRDLIFQIDPEGTIVYCSQSVERILGYTPDEVIDKKFSNYLYPSDATSAMQLFHRVVSGEGVELFEVRVVDRNGKGIPLEISAAPVVQDGMVRLIQGVARDISERKRIEKALQLERKKLFDILKAMEDGVYIVNQRYDIEFINPVLEREFGPSEGQKCYQYFHDRKEICPWCKNKDVFAGESVRWQWKSFKNNKICDLIDIPIINSEGSISKLEIFRDITNIYLSEWYQ